MTSPALLAGGPTVDGTGGHYFGVYPAIVTSLVGDPAGQQRVEVSFPWLGSDGDSVRAWARLLSPYAEDDQGLLAVPSVDTEVVVAFEAGELARPYVIGSAWNGKEAMPETPTASNDKRVLKSRAGTILEFDDTDGMAKVTLEMSCGHKLVLDDTADTVTITSKSGGKVEITAGGGITITAVTKLDITAPMVNVDTAMAKFSGVVKCETLIASSAVVSPSYTPGAGNIW